MDSAEIDISDREVKLLIDKAGRFSLYIDGQRFAYRSLSDREPYGVSKIEARLGESRIRTTTESFDKMEQQLREAIHNEPTG